MMKQPFQVSSNTILVSDVIPKVVDITDLWQKRGVPLGVRMFFATFIMGVFTLSSSNAWAQEIHPDRPVLPAMSLTDDGALSIWRNPANLAFDPDPSFGFVYATPIESGIENTTPNSLAFAGNAGPLGLGLAHQTEVGHPEWWTLTSSLGIPLNRSWNAGVGVGWQLPAGTENNFATLDAGLGWRPLNWLGFSAVGYNLGASSTHPGIEEQLAGGLTLRPARDLVEIGAEYKHYTRPDSEVRGYAEGTLKVQPMEGLTLRMSGNQFGTIGAGIEVGFGDGTIGGHARAGSSGSQTPIAMASVSGAPDSGDLLTDWARVPEVAINESFPYQPTRSFFIQEGESYLHLLERLHDAATSTKTRAMVLRVDWSPFSFAQTEEILAIFDKAQANGKKVIVYLGEDSGNSAYFLASGADLVLMNPAQQLMLVGLSVELMFFRGTLDMVGIEPQFARRAEYKSAAEQMTNTEASQSQREQMNALLDDMSGRMVARIAQGRAKHVDDVTRLIDGGPYTAEEAMGHGLIDALAFPDEIHEKVRAHMGKVVHFDDKWGLTDGVSGWKPTHEIAVVYVNGTITTGPSQGPGLFGGSNTAGSETISAELMHAQSESTVKAVILRVDSPGGSAYASDEIWRAVAKVRESGKPVIVSMGGVAASGGYYVSAGANAIYAQNSTITGSIGVIGGKVNFEGLYEKLGVNYELYNRGRNAAIFSSSKPFDTVEFAAFDRMLGDIYTQFTNKVALGRSMEQAEVEEVARGRVWSGQRAKDARLVDEIGGFHDAIERAKKEAKIGEKVSVELVTFKHRGGPADTFTRVGVQLMQQAFFPKMSAKPIPELEMLEQWQAVGDEKVWTLMPYRVNVR
jgi:protease-4